MTTCLQLREKFTVLCCLTLMVLLVQSPTAMGQDCTGKSDLSSSDEWVSIDLYQSGGPKDSVSYAKIPEGRKYLLVQSQELRAVNQSGEYGDLAQKQRVRLELYCRIHGFGEYSSYQVKLEYKERFQLGEVFSLGSFGALKMLTSLNLASASVWAFGSGRQIPSDETVNALFKSGKHEKVYQSHFGSHYPHIMLTDLKCRKPH